MVAILDIETTSLEPWRGTIVEIGICYLDLVSGKITKLMDTPCREMTFDPRNDGQTWIFAHSDLSVDDVMNAPKFEELIPLIQKICDDHILSAFNKEFDFYFLKSRKIKIPREGPCIMRAATITVSGGQKQRSNLKEVWKALFPDEKYVQKHRAYDDAVHEALIAYMLFMKGFWNVEETTKQN